ncbi:MAG TPA: polysaccharide deacetylase family protein, partial [Ferruginibacter sp.]|nr:polysaccharide deacetylase family protein [Ferruginibacter sp.]
MQPAILISFDVEEFDIPLEYQCEIAMDQQMAIGKHGLDVVLPVLEQHNVRGTMFTTAHFADQFPEAVQRMAKQHEIASHTYYHSSFENKDLLASRLRLEALSGQSVVGLRMPRMRFVEMSEVKKAGYRYDSSINPTWIPGRYNNLRLSRTVYFEEGVPRLPASVSPNLRIPLFWLG